MKLSERMEMGREAAPWCIDRVKELEAEVEQLHEALRKYGMHKGDVCGFSFCRCGLKEAMERKEEDGEL